ncbi:MAG: galactose-1-phosphate uridylyltransferase [Zestosphaera sp.]
MGCLHELRWNPLIKQWVVVSPHRATRPWRPDKGVEGGVACPFCPGAPELGHLDRWKVTVLSNKYPALVPEPPHPLKPVFRAYEAREAQGASLVVVETPEHEGDFHTLSLEHVAEVVETYRSESARLSRLEYVEYVAVFKNKGREVGVSLTHPHSQIYALPFTPPRIQAELNAFEEYRRIGGGCLLCDILDYERRAGARVVYENEQFTALLPYYAMWPYEIHVCPRGHVRSLRDLDASSVRFLADVLRAVTATYTELLGRDAPYIMVFHDHPSKGSHAYHFHVEFYQPYRDRGRLKYAAGIEQGFWVFTYDGAPEERAEELRDACREGVGMVGGIIGKCF